MYKMGLDSCSHLDFIADHRLQHVSSISFTSARAFNILNVYMARVCRVFFILNVAVPRFHFGGGDPFLYLFILLSFSLFYERNTYTERLHFELNAFFIDGIWFTFSEYLLVNLERWSVSSLRRTIFQKYHTNGNKSSAERTIPEFGIWK